MDNRLEIICCICGCTMTDDIGHNPYPLYYGDNCRCCDRCNYDTVVPARIRLLRRKDSGKI